MASMSLFDAFCMFTRGYNRIPPDLPGKVSHPRGQGDLLLLDQRWPQVQAAETHPCVLVESANGG